MIAQREAEGGKQVPAVARVLDALVVAGHQIRIFGRRYHPYFVAWDCCVAAALGVIVWYTTYVSSNALWRVLLQFLLLLLGYEAYLLAKFKLRGKRSRSFMQDTLFFGLPCYLLSGGLLGLSLRSSLDLFALVIPTMLAFVRFGCFFGGCCYGKPAAWGVHYPAHLLKPVTTWRRFTPGPVPQGRMVPIQLIESLVSVLIVFALVITAHLNRVPSGRLLPLFFLSYGSYRFVADFYRTVSVRPRIGRWSEAQVVSIVVVVLSAATLALANFVQIF